MTRQALAPARIQGRRLNPALLKTPGQLKSPRLAPHPFVERRLSQIRPQRRPRLAEPVRHAGVATQTQRPNRRTLDFSRNLWGKHRRENIQAALAMTGDNRASAAQLLGLSRQSLYVKLRRFGIAELEARS